MTANATKRVCLLFPYFDEGFIMRKVPLGLAYLASALEAKGVYVEAYNLNVDDIEAIDLASFDFFGITCLTPFVREIESICARIRQNNTTARIVLGGTHPTLATQHTLDALPEVDYVIKAEGEVSFPRLVTEEESYATIPGVYVRDADGTAVGLPAAPPNIHELAYPNVGLFDHGELEKRNPLRPILTMRGCPWQCKNCQPNLTIVQPYRLRQVDDVIAEIEHRQRAYGQTYFGFLDSEFPIKKRWFVEFHEKIHARRIDFEFHCNARADLLDRDVLRMYRDLNISRLAMGVESGSQRVVDTVVNKRLDLKVTADAFDAAAEIGLRTHAHFMIGLPGETLDDMQETLDYAMDLPTTSVEFNFLTPWPGTHFYDLCVERGYLTETDVAKFNEKRVPVVATEDFTPEQVMDFYHHLRRTLTGLGWQPAPDGTVFYHPDFDGEDLAPPPAVRPGLRKPVAAGAMM